MEHRGTCGGDDESRDGAGIMTQIPWRLFSEYTSNSCPKPGVGMIFFPQDKGRRKTPERLDSDNEDCDGFERSLYLVRLHFDVELRLRGLVCYESDSEVYVASFSLRIIVYKGMVQGCMVPQFYKDLTNPDFTVFDQRGTRLASSPSLKNLTL